MYEPGQSCTYSTSSFNQDWVEHLSDIALATLSQAQWSLHHSGALSRSPYFLYCWPGMCLQWPNIWATHHFFWIGRDLKKFFYPSILIYQAMDSWVSGMHYSWTDPTTSVNFSPPMSPGSLSPPQPASLLERTIFKFGCCTLDPLLSVLLTLRKWAILSILSYRYVIKAVSWGW